MRPSLLALRFVFAAVFLFPNGLAAAREPESCLGGRIYAIVGEPHEVPRGPAFVSIGDINNDGLNDAAVSCVNDDTIVSALSDGRGNFDSLVFVPIGRRIGDVALFHADDDGVLDVVTTDLIVSGFGDGILVAKGSGDGHYGVPYFVEATTRAAKITIADIDGKNGLDIITANGRRVNFQTRNAAVTAILNRSGDRDFDPGISYSIGSRSQPDDVEAGDFDSDGDVDLVVVDTKANNTDEIVIMLNDGKAGFESIVNFTTGLRGVAATVTDLNRDGALDIIVLNDDRDRFKHSLSVLLNRTNQVDGVRCGNGVFDVLPPVHVACPSSYNGLPIVCRMNDIGTADFNLDGSNDIVISIDTRTEDDIGITTPGIIAYYEGLGDGGLVFSTALSIGAGASGIAVGDVTGDAIPDVVVAESKDNTLTVLRTIGSEPRPNGGACCISQQCESGMCVDGTCCGSASCATPQRCDIPGHEGECSEVGAAGAACYVGEQCKSSSCVDGFCCAAASCPVGQFCNTGACSPPASSGANCTAGEQCSPPNCVDGKCCTTPSCPAGERCDIPGVEGSCTPRLPLGDACSANGQCASGFCTDGVCCSVDRCEPGKACNIAPNQGDCSLLPTPTRTPTATPTPRVSGGCTANSDCVSNFCVDGNCCATAACPPNQYCNISDAIGECAPRKAEGSGCTMDMDCRSGNCDMNRPDRPEGYYGLCGPARTPTPLGPGASCTERPRDCLTGFVCNELEGFICCDEPRCPPGRSCRVPGHEGFCVPLPTPTPTRFPNVPLCSPNKPELCQSGNCVDGICCEDAACAGPDRCDIFGLMGRCMPPLVEGEDCRKNTDCEGGLLCLNDDGTGLKCSRGHVHPTPPPTPTRHVDPPVSPDHDGCNLRGNGGGWAWMLMIVPIAWGNLAR